MTTVCEDQQGSRQRLVQTGVKQGGNKVCVCVCVCVHVCVCVSVWGGAEVYVVCVKVKHVLSAIVCLWFQW